MSNTTKCRAQLDTYLGDVVAVASDDASHEIVVAAQVLRRAIIHDVRPVLQRPLQVRAHHRVVDHDDRVLALLLHQRADPRNVHNLQQRVRRGLEEHHRRLARVEHGNDGLGDGGVDMVHGDAHVRPEVGEEAVRPPIEVVSRDDLAAWLEQARDNVERGHATRHREGMRGRRYFGNVMLCAHRKSIHHYDRS